MLVDSPIPNLNGGVSQQPPLSRFANQLNSQDNCLSDPVNGLRKRPPTEWIARVIAGPGWEGAAVLPIDRDKDNRFVALVANGQIRVFDTVDGTERTVTGDASYLATSEPRRDILSLTVADYTFVANRSVATAKGSPTVPGRPYEALIFIRAGNYSRKYEVWINGQRRVYYKTPTGSDPDQGPNIDTANLALTLKTGVAPVNSSYDEVSGSLDSVPGLTTTQIGSLLYLTSATDFTIRVEDGQGGEAMRAIKDTVQSFTDLPRGGKEGFRVKIRGSQGSTDDDYYVEYEGNETWKECPASGVLTSLDPATMPHALIKQTDGSFTFEALPWVDRRCGDDESNPFPSFVGLPISSMFYFGNRLGFLADETMVLSQADDYFNLFRTTVTQLIDSDPIDLIAGDSSGESSPVAKLKHAVPFDRKLLLFAENAQFLLDSDRQVLSPRTAKLDPTTSFAASAQCRPVTAGRMVYFAFDRDGASGIREFYVDGAAQTEDAQEVTAHCPTYLPPRISRMTGTTLENVILALTDEELNRAYVYRYFWSGQDKIQSAWCRWTFDTNARLLSCDFFGNVAYLVIARPDGVHLERIRFRPRLTDVGLTYFTHLDSRISGPQVSMTYSAVTDRTTIAMPYSATGPIEVYTLESSSGAHAPGLKVPHTADSLSAVSVPGDKTGWSLVVGRAYDASFEPTRPFWKRRDGTANTEAVVKVRDYSLDYADTGFFEVTFTPAFREPRTKSFSGRFLGTTSLSSPPMEEGTFRMKTPCQNKYWGLRFNNSSPFPSAVLAASWRGLVESKSRSV